jgi:hypothetical protein
MKDHIIKYYDSAQSYYGTYHNQKEVSAWAGLVLHVLFLGFVSRIEAPKHYYDEITLSIIVVSLLVSVLTYRYISNQLKMKDQAGAHAGAAKFLLAKVMLEDESQIDAKWYLEVEDSDDLDAQSSHVLPAKMLAKSKALNTRARGFQDRTKNMIYAILFLSSVFVIAIRYVDILG